jgi:arabinofuranosyltransferase
VPAVIGSTGRARVQITGFCLALLAVAGSVLLNAWICDDAYVTMRTVDAFLRGEGLVWNPGERVQAWTHPLWLGVLVVLRGVGLSAYAALLGAGLLCTAGFVVMLRALQRSALLWPVLLALAASPAFVHFSTSGLEAPLTHLLIAAFYLGVVRTARLRWLVLLASAVALNRMDTVLFCVLPLLCRAYEDVRARGLRGALGDVALGAAPLVAWFAFSLIYYGSLVPNTAHAKLAHGIARSEIFRQGVSYLGTTVTFDPAGSVLALVGVMAALADKRRSVVLAGIGTVLYLLYVVSVGGDFMAGRFTTPVLASGALLLVLSSLGERLLAVTEKWWAATGLLVAIGVLGALPHHHVATPFARTFALPIPEGPVSLHATHWVTVEQGFYWDATALVEVARHGISPPDHEWTEVGRRMKELGGVHMARNIGFTGYATEGGATLVDPYALSDAFLARLPAVRNIDWHVGHYRRHIPEGYLRSVQDGHCQMADPELCELFDLVRRVTHGPVFASGRMGDIVRLQRYRPSPGLAERMVFGERVESSEHPRHPVQFVDSGIEIRLEAPTTGRWTARVSACLAYELRFLRDDQEVAVEQVSARPAPDGRGQCLLRPEFHGTPFNRVQVLTLERPGPYFYFGRGLNE